MAFDHASVVESTESLNESDTLSRESTTEIQFLQLYLDSNLPVLLPVHQLIEIITIPLGQIVPIFHMPAWVMGVYNCRGEVLWMIDLNHLLGLTPWYQQVEYGSKHTAIILKVYAQDGQSGDEKEPVLGLVVNRAEGMISCHLDAIKREFEWSNITSKLKPFLQGYWQDSMDKSHLILNGAAIMQAMPT
jgi:positive phototaxis protein PixI